MAQVFPPRLKHAWQRALVAAAPVLWLCACSGQSGSVPEVAIHRDALPTDQSLVDIDGVPHGTLASPAAGKYTALIFVRTDCPVSNQYAPEIKRICAEYEPKGMQCLLVYADAYDTVEAIRRHRADFGYTMPAIRDPAHALVARAGATITPEVAVFTKDAALAYSGRIDNLYSELGKPRQQVTEHDLRDALDDLIAGHAVRTPRTPATGCFIE
jgi:hypothetical protein